MEIDKNKIKIAIVIPYYNAANQIKNVLAKIPGYVTMVVVVNDNSPQPLPTDLCEVLHEDVELFVLINIKNLGVGGATKHGFQFVLDYGAHVVIKVDADDQMDLNFLPKLIKPLIENKCDVAKGNRFRDFKALKKMPLTRRVGNLTLSFLTKMATGYWNNFDPTNGYIAIKTSLISAIDLEKLSNRYFFETSLLAQFYFEKAIVKDVAMPAIYADEKSSMNVWKMPFVFGGKLLSTFFKRILKEYFLYDFNIGSMYILTGTPLFFFGIIYGAVKWLEYYTLKIPAPTGTIMIITLSIILGFQLILQAIQYDIIKAPNNNNN
jgi:dolichol-phosphate mannosyltransferase